MLYLGQQVVIEFRVVTASQPTGHAVGVDGKQFGLLTIVPSEHMTPTLTAAVTSLNDVEQI